MLTSDFKSHVTPLYLSCPRYIKYNFDTTPINLNYLLHLELDCGLQVINFLLHVVGVGQKGREFAGLVQTRSQQTWNLLDQRLWSKESIVALGQLLDQFLLLVQLLEVISAHEGDVLGLGLIAMVLITENANAELWAGNVTQPVKKLKLLFNFHAA